MTDQLCFHLPPGARTTDPDTSVKAANRRTGDRKTDRRMALMYHYHCRDTGLTDFELAVYMNRQQTSAGKRRGELRDNALIAATEERRPAPSGSLAIVWKITEAGITEAEKL